MSAEQISDQDMLNALRDENIRSQVETTITVYKDGSYKVWSRRDAEYGAKEDDFLVNINLPVERDLDRPVSAQLLAAYAKLTQGSDN